MALGESQPAAQAEWSAIAEQKTSYTTDAFQYSSARRLALSEDPSQPTVVPLGKPEDVIWELALEAIRSSSNSLGQNELSVKAHGYIYTDKSIFNYGKYLIQDRQRLDSETSILDPAWVSICPKSLSRSQLGAANGNAFDSRRAGDVAYLESGI